MKVLITGPNGFIGSFLTSHFKSKEGFTVVPLSSLDKKKLFEIPLAVEPCDAVIHLASKVFIPESWEDPYSFYQTNTQGTLNILEYCRQNKARMLFLSSVVYSQPFSNPISENHKLGASNPYTHSKLLAEELCLFYLKNFGVDATILRPFNIYGPGQKKSFLIPTIVNQALNPNIEQIKLQSTSSRRDYLFIEDLANLIEKVLLSPNPGVYNAASGQSFSVKEVVELILEVVGVHKPIVVSSGVKRQNDPQEVVADISKARMTFDWEPLCSLKDGIKKIVQHQLSKEIPSNE